jgi:hypothetical protein
MRTKLGLIKPQSLRKLGRFVRGKRDKFKLGFEEVLCAVDWTDSGSDGMEGVYYDDDDDEPAGRYKQKSS